MLKFFLKPGLNSAQMLVVSDINDVFVPLQAGFLADPFESRYIINYNYIILGN
jgi:protein transport protein SEC24